MIVYIFLSVSIVLSIIAIILAIMAVVIAANNPIQANEMDPMFIQGREISLRHVPQEPINDTN